MHLHYKPRLRSGTPVSLWQASSDSKNRSINFNNYVPYFPPLYPESSLYWIKRQPSFDTKNYQMLSAAYGNGMWVVGGENGGIQSSTNGINWTTRNAFFGSDAISDIAYGNGIWVAISSNSNKIRTSTDTISWNTRSFTLGVTKIYSVAYGNGIWSAIGIGCQTSTDTITWVSRSWPTTVCYTIAYGNGRWIAGGVNTQIITSTNGSTWGFVIPPQSGYASWRKVAYANGRWVIGGWPGQEKLTVPQLRNSTNGLVWVTQNPKLDNIGGGNFINTVSYGNGLWMLGGQMHEDIRISTDTVNWVTQSVEPWTSIVRNASSLIYGNGLWVLTGIGYPDVNPDWSELETSYHWYKKRIGNPYNSLQRGVYGNGNWIVSEQSSRIYKSTNAINWVTGPLISDRSIYAMAYGNGVWLAGGDGPTTSEYGTYFMQYMLSDDNGITWITKRFPYVPYSDPSINYIYKMCYGNGIWFALVAPGGQLIPYSSSSPYNWGFNPVSTNMTYTIDIQYGNNLFVAVGGSGTGSAGATISTSTNSISWISRNPNTAGLTGYHRLNSLAYGNGKWVAVGYSGLMRTSTDAITWVTQNSQTSNDIWRVAYGNGVWHYLDVQGGVKISFDTITWITRSTSLTGAGFISYGDNIWVAGGASGEISISVQS